VLESERISISVTIVSAQKLAKYLLSAHFGIHITYICSFGTISVTALARVWVSK